jgi:hypothetical protein
MVYYWGMFLYACLKILKDRKWHWWEGEADIKGSKQEGYKHEIFNLI